MKISSEERIKVAKACHKIMEVIEPKTNTKATETDIDTYEAAKKLKVMFVNDVAKNGEKTDLKFSFEKGVSTEDMPFLVSELEQNIDKIVSEKHYQNKKLSELVDNLNSVQTFFNKYTQIEQKPVQPKLK